MTILEDLATTRAPVIMELLETHRESARRRDIQPSRADGFDNRPAWDNWSKAAPKFSKKRVYFRKK